MTDSTIAKNVQRWTKRILGKRAEHCTAAELGQVNEIIRQYNVGVRQAAFVGQRALAEVRDCTAGCRVEKVGRPVPVDARFITPEAIAYLSTAHAVHLGSCPKSPWYADCTRAVTVTAPPVRRTPSRAERKRRRRKVR